MEKYEIATREQVEAHLRELLFPRVEGNWLRFVPTDEQSDESIITQAARLIERASTKESRASTFWHALFRYYMFADRAGKLVPPDQEQLISFANATPAELENQFAGLTSEQGSVMLRRSYLFLSARVEIDLALRQTDLDIAKIQLSKASEFLHGQASKTDSAGQVVYHEVIRQASTILGLVSLCHSTAFRVGLTDLHGLVDSYQPHFVESADRAGGSGGNASNLVRENLLGICAFVLKYKHGLGYGQIAECLQDLIEEGGREIQVGSILSKFRRRLVEMAGQDRGASLNRDEQIEIATILGRQMSS